MKLKIFIYFLVLSYLNITISKPLFIEDPNCNDYANFRKFAALADFKVTQYFPPYVNPRYCILDYFTFTNQITDNSVVYICRKCVPIFFEKVHPQINGRYILITSEYPEPSPSIWVNFLKDPKLLAWCSMHPDVINQPKFLALPNGYAPNRKVDDDQLKKTAPILRAIPKTKLLYMNFEVKNHPERKRVYSLFSHKKYCFKSIPKPFFDYLKEMAQFKFVLSPRGVGIDCYRTWEALIVGSIPIVKSSYLDPLYKDLPILIINDWNQITEAFLNKKYAEITSKQYRLDKLCMPYWVKEINKFKIK